MANLSVIAAVLDRLATKVTASVYFNEVPMGDGNGGQPVLPFVVVFDEGTSPEYTLEYECVETTRLRIEVFGTADTIEPTVRLVKYGAGAYNAGDGLDFCSLTVGGQTVLQVVRTSEVRAQEAARDGSGKLVYRCSLTYEVEAQVIA